MMQELFMLVPEVEQHGDGGYSKDLTGASSDAWAELVRALEDYSSRAKIDRETAVRLTAKYIDRFEQTALPTGDDQELGHALFELHHRIKNQLQIIIGLMSRSSRSAHSPTEQIAWSTCLSQIAAMASLHELLTPGRLSGRVHLGVLLKNVCEGFSRAFGDRKRISIKTELADIDASTATSEILALILNEALTNAIKHGKSSGGATQVTLRTQGDGRFAVLAISNDGRHGDHQVEPSSGFGTKLIDLLGNKLGARISRVATRATYTLECTFPLD